MVVVAEGAGQNHVVSDKPGKRDASGNRILDDVGLWLTERVNDHLKDATDLNPFAVK